MAIRLSKLNREQELREKIAILEANMHGNFINEITSLEQIEPEFRDNWLEYADEVLALLPPPLDDKEMVEGIAKTIDEIGSGEEPRPTHIIDCPYEKDPDCAKCWAEYFISPFLAPKLAEKALGEVSNG